MGKFRHVRLKRIADKKRRGTAQQDHRHDRTVFEDFANSRWSIAPAQPTTRAHAFAGVSRVRNDHEPNSQRQIDQGVHQQTCRRAKHQHQTAADGRTEQNAELPAGRVEPHRARQIAGADNVVNQQDLGGRPKDAGDAMNHQQDTGMPNFDGVGKEKYRPRR